MTYDFDWGFCDLAPALADINDVERTFTEVAALRPKVWRIDVAWNYIAKAQAPGTASFDSVNNVPTTTNRDWTTVDRFLNDMLLVVGCDVLMMIGQARPQWGGISWLFGWGATIGNSTDYQNFCAEVATRYKPGGVGIRTDGKYAPNAGKGVTKFEFWNEENNSFFWGNACDPAGYTDLAIHGSTGIKSVLPGTASTCVLGGLQHVPRAAPWFGYGWLTMDEVTFLSRCYDWAASKGTTLGAHFDAFAEHVYTQTDTTGYGGTVKGPAPDPNTDNLQQLRLIRDLMVAKGDGAKPIYITECGFSTNIMTEAQQASYMQQLFDYFQTLPYVKMVLIYNARDSGTDKSYVEDNWGVMTFGFVHKVVWNWLLTLKPDKVVQPAAAALSLVGSRPALATTVRPVGGALSTVGGTPKVTVSDNRNIVPTAATLTLTEFIPQVLQSDNNLLTPFRAELALTGGTPKIVQPQLISPPASALVLAGGTPSVIISAASILTPGPAVLLLAGGVPVVTPSDHKVLTPSASPLALVTSAPVVRVSDNKVLTPSAAPLALAGGAPAVGVTLNQLLQPINAALTLTPGTPSIVQATAAVPPTFQAAFGGGGNNGFIGSLSPTVSATAGNGANRYALIVVANRHGGQAYSAQTTTCKYGSANCTKLIGVSYASDCSMEVWEYWGPPSAATNVAYSCGNGSNTGREVAMSILIYNGVASRSPTVSTNGGTSNIQSCTVAPTSTELSVMAMAENSNSAVTAASGQTLRSSVGSGGSFAATGVVEAPKTVTTLQSSTAASVGWTVAGFRLSG